jgi:hypothetical protein
VLRTGIRRLGLYDLFSIFVPGVTIVVGLLPFLPEKTSLGTGGVGAVVLLGFAVGRGVHTAAIWAENAVGGQTHRDRFYDELKQPDSIEPQTISAFLDAFESVYTAVSIERQQHIRADEENETDDRSAGDGRVLANESGRGNGGVSLYTLVRSYVHIDSRGRSRRFQAIYALHRGMGFATLLLTGVYVLYGGLDMFELLTGVVDYTSYIGTLGLPPLLLVLGPLLIGSVAFGTSRRGTRVHGQYYVQYLISDFLTLYEAETIEDGDPTVRPPPAAW